MMKRLSSLLLMVLIVASLATVQAAPFVVVPEQMHLVSAGLSTDFSFTMVNDGWNSFVPLIFKYRSMNGAPVEVVIQEGTTVIYRETLSSDKDISINVDVTKTSKRYTVGFFAKQTQAQFKISVYCDAP